MEWVITDCLFFRLNQEQTCAVSSFAMTDVVVDDHVAGGVGIGLFPRNDANDVLASKALTNPCRSIVLPPRRMGNFEL